jgi:nucleotide-binding universal stress UspA family protein
MVAVVLLLAYDGSPSARAAVERCAALFPDAEAVVTSVASGLANVADAATAARVALSDEMIRTAVARLRESAIEDARELAAEGARLAADAGLRARAETGTAGGAPWSELADAAHRAGAALIGCGTHGHGLVARAILGSVSSGLVQHSGMPVLVVPAEPAEGDGPVLVGFDASEPAARALTAAASLLRGREALVVHVWRSQVRHTLTGQALRRGPVPEIRELTDELERLFAGAAGEDAEQGAALAREHGLDAQGRAIESDRSVASVLLETAGAEGAPAIVVGRRGRGAVASAVLGSVSSSLLHAADRPVLLA